MYILLSTIPNIQFQISEFPTLNSPKISSPIATLSLPRQKQPSKGLTQTLLSSRTRLSAASRHIAQPLPRQNSPPPPAIPCSAAFPSIPRATSRGRACVNPGAFSAGVRARELRRPLRVPALLRLMARCESPGIRSDHGGPGSSPRRLIARRSENSSGSGEATSRSEAARSRRSEDRCCGRSEVQQVATD